MDIFHEINALVSYAVGRELVEAEDSIFCRNRILEKLGLDSFEGGEEILDVGEGALEGILKNILDFAAQKGLVEDSVVFRDIFDTELMGVFVSKPSEISRKFWELYGKSPKEATDFFYRFSGDTDYIRRYRVKRDLKWTAETEFGTMDITINLSKPEKDPKAIAAARNVKAAGYPKCLLCKENVGYAGRADHAARATHRIIELDLAGERWGFQYSPYVYYNEHCIVFSMEHSPMKICGKTFERLLDFVGKFPHYTLGSNADLPIVGGSILTHDHFQGGAYEFPMARAEIREEIDVGVSGVEAGIVRWPMSVLRIRSESKEKIVGVSENLLEKWRNYTDSGAFIFAETDGERHNTLNPIARFRNGKFEMDLVFRNNITTEEHPLGVYHPHAELHHIKKENIGLIEVMGLAILPGRLKKELSALADALSDGTDISSSEELSKHAQWLSEIRGRHGKVARKDAEEILRQEVGAVFSKVLEHAGVFKKIEDFEKFLKS